MARLAPVPLTTRSAVNVPGITRWLWADTSGNGLHLESELCQSPAEVTHVWGWDEAGIRLVRLRVDRDLGDGDEPGVVGAVLDLSGSGQGEQVDVESWDSQVWHPNDGRINADQQHPVFTGSRLARLHTVYRETAAADGLTQTPLTFIHLEA
jgi:hypothetical protein